MPGRKHRPSTVETRFLVGDHVRVDFGASTVEAEIVEDRGFVGAGGRHIFRVRPTDPSLDDPGTFEVRADDLLVAADADGAA